MQLKDKLACFLMILSNPWFSFFHNFDLMSRNFLSPYKVMTFLTEPFTSHQQTCTKWWMFSTQLLTICPQAWLDVGSSIKLKILTEQSLIIHIPTDNTQTLNCNHFVFILLFHISFIICQHSTNLQNKFKNGRRRYLKFSIKSFTIYNSII